MSWFSAIFRQPRPLDPENDYEPQACYNSFCQHWQQANYIMQHSRPSQFHDDVLSVVNLLEQLGTLLVLEARAKELNRDLSCNPTSCIEYLLSENVLDTLYQWYTYTGKYKNAVQLEQLKLYGILVSHYSSQVLAAEPFLRTILKFLSKFRNDLPPSTVEHQLVILLNQLCVVLMQNMKFIDLFFVTNHGESSAQTEWIIVRLLLISVHREGRTGAIARDALLLCAKMSASNEELANYMLSDSNTCPILATGLSGLYSLLPRVLDRRMYRLTPDHVNEIHKLTLFIDSLEFCNAVAQVAHPSIKAHLIDLMYQGFLVPVMGPALLQTKEELQNGYLEQAAATAYLELCIRCVTPEGLLKTMLKFLMQYKYDGVKVIDVLLDRLRTAREVPYLLYVTLSLMETLIDLNCEDVMIELVFKYILNGDHFMPAVKHRITDPEFYREAAIALQSLTPKCCTRPLSLTREWAASQHLKGKRVIGFGNNENAEERTSNSVNDSSIAMNNLVRDVKLHYGNENETSFHNYYAYLRDARFEIVYRTLACSKWSSKYDSCKPLKRENNNNSTREKEISMSPRGEKEQDSLISIGYETIKKEPHSLTSFLDNDKDVPTMEAQGAECTGKEHDSLTSIGESSGYDSFRYRGDDNEEGEVFAEESFWKCIAKNEMYPKRSASETPLKIESNICIANSNEQTLKSLKTIGPLLTALLDDRYMLQSPSLINNLRITGVVSKLVSLPMPLLASFLLCPVSMLQPNVVSLYETLTHLKNMLDAMTSGISNVDELVDKARVYLIQRELTAINPRKKSNNDSVTNAPAPSQPEEPPSRHTEQKRKSLSMSFSSMIAKLSPSSRAHDTVDYAAPYNSRATQKTGYKYTEEEYWEQTKLLVYILNAVILDEWLKELSAMAEEHALRLSAGDYEDDVYFKCNTL